MICLKFLKVIGIGIGQKCVTVLARFFYKCKDGGTQWLDHDIIPRLHREKGSAFFKKYFLKKANE
ncbi:hypothetical protein [Bartonella massiliensis]|uniref:hypothetical protein n=1 Tax=Bartonella massiliensis TaxID=929795 RepID=UPI00115803BC|nr:hypothetical protein [Bartonella massiliensis]